MATVTATTGGFMIDKVIYFGDDESVSSQVRLSQQKGEIMKYGTDALAVIDFPGEYDIRGLNVRCVEAGGKLSFIIKMSGEMVAVMSNVEALDVAVFDGVDLVLCVTPGVKEEAEKLELDADIRLLEEEEDSDEEAEE